MWRGKHFKIQCLFTRVSFPWKRGNNRSIILVILGDFNGDFIDFTSGSKIHGREVVVEFVYVTNVLLHLLVELFHILLKLLPLAEIFLFLSQFFGLLIFFPQPEANRKGNVTLYKPPVKRVRPAPSAIPAATSAEAIAANSALANAATSAEKDAMLASIAGNKGPNSRTAGAPANGTIVPPMENRRHQVQQPWSRQRVCQQQLQQRQA